MIMTKMETDNHQFNAIFKVTRPVYSEKSFAQHYQIAEKSNCNEKSCCERIKTALERVCTGVCCHDRKLDWLRRRFPIVEWFPKYHLRQDGIPDLVGGLTVSVMHIPQGLAFAMIASLPAVTGLYTSLIPVFIYMFMGTSKYLSQGAFPVVCLMIADVVNREVSKNNHLEATKNTTADPALLESVWSPEEAKKLEVAISLALFIGIIQVAMGFLKLGVIATYLSDPVVSGFTTGAALHVVIGQIKSILGLNLPRQPGLFSLVKVVIMMCTNITRSNIGSIITGLTCLIILMGLKHLNQRYTKRLPFPIPSELIVVILSTAISYAINLHSRFGVQIVKNIPKGMPPLSVPSFTLMADIYSDAFKIAIIIFAVNVSIAKLFAKKDGHKIDCNQELISYGVCNVGVAFFSGFPVSVALGRVVVHANIARTQLSTIPVIIVLLMVLLFIAHLFYHLPKAVLSAVVIANLINVLKQFSRIKQLWTICKPDAVLWCITFFGVILLGIDLGLGCGVLGALLSVTIRSSKPHYSILGNIPHTDVYRDVETNPQAREQFGIKIIRFESSLYYGNVEYFKDLLLSLTFSHNNHGDTAHVTVQETNRKSSQNDVKYRNEEKSELGTDWLIVPVTPHTVIIDASTFTNIDSMGIEALRSSIQELRRREVQIYLANCSDHFIRQLRKSGCMDSDFTSLMFISIHDAVLYCGHEKSKQLTETRC